MLVWVAACWVWSGTAMAQSPLEDALADYEQAHFDSAFESFERALDSGGLGPQQLAQVYLHLGALHAIRGQLALARDAFVVALAIDPSLEPPRDLGPRHRGSFYEAQRIRSGRSFALSLRAPESVRRDQHLQLGVSLSDAPESVVTSIEVRATDAAGGAAWSRRVEPDATMFAIDPSDWTTDALLVTVNALDTRGNVLALASLTLTARAPDSSTETSELSVTPVLLASELRPAGHDDASFFAEPWFWIVVGALLVGAAVTLGVVLAAADDRYSIGAPGP